MKSVDTIVNSIIFFTFNAWDSDGIPMSLNGLKVRYMDLTSGNCVEHFFFEKYGSLERFTEERGGGIEVVSEKYIFGNYDSTKRAEQHLLGLQMIESFKIAFELQEIEAVHTKYSIDQCYGGSEEGGWYYDNYYAVERLDEMVSEEQQYEERYEYMYATEFFYGQHQKTGREYYC